MKYFSFSEFEKSSTAKAKGIDNSIPLAVKPNIERLVDNVLDPLRIAYGKPIIVTSGYRCEALNKAVGGASTSHHVKGMAADIVAKDRADNHKLYKLILDLGLNFTQLIWEKGNATNPDWVHVSYDPSNLKRQILKS